MLASATACAALAACGGGGEGSSTMNPVAFTSFSNVVPGQPVVAEGVSQTAIVIMVSGDVTSFNPNFVNTNATSATLTYGSGSPPALTGLVINAPPSGLSFTNGLGGQSVTCSTGMCLAKGDGGRALLVNALDAAINWNYQTLGYWQAGAGGTGNNVAGAMSVGNPTVGGNIPLTGTPTYSGRVGGLFADTASGALLEFVATMTVSVNFAMPTPTVSFTTTGTQTRAWESTGAFGTPPGGAGSLDISTPAAIAYVAGVNSLQGNIVAGPGSGSVTMLGQVTGRFGGPAAEEMGGTFSLSFGTQSMIGAFGAKK